ncbi:peptidoglycan DD-metalloendopeptidase family protein [Demequina litorisediminis]|uniref:M23ase beta-sheet core domain-containing protein n=1 Tax=Demequina litorisediminis TaxID=1849022 RepID=A0ABQ6IJZ7_9MICO|nr:peptidoglycan DD-metalloendopeptidase family protein [Demequina litorisediminis]GMA37038.1 hypothetical protein GCM10025876_32420 [Demequina litorisediminis]
MTFLSLRWFGLVAAGMLLAVAAATPGAAMPRAVTAATATATATAASGEHAPLASPLTPMRLVSPAVLPAQPWLPGHRGIDLAAAPGDNVTSPGPGIITFAGVVVDRPVVTVTHDDGLRSSLEPVTATVALGDAVSAGSSVGVVADSPSHCEPDTCVHWGVRDGDTYLDPLDLLAGFGPVILLEVE